MFRCDECDRDFPQPRIYGDNQGECFGDTAVEKYLGCPYCGGGFYRREACAVCGELCGEDELISGICGDCGAAVLCQLGYLVDQEFPPAERKYIREMLEI